MKNFLSKFAYIAPTIVAIAMIALMSGINTALADRVSTAAGTVSSIGVSSSGSITVGSSPVTTSGTITADLNLANSNTWTALQQFASGASTTMQSVFGTLYVGGAATTTIQGNTNATSTISGNLEVTGRFRDDSITSALLLDDSQGLAGAYGGTSCTNQFVRSVNAAGAATCNSVANTDLTNSTIALSDSNSTLTIGGTPAALGGTLTATLNLGHTNTWTALQTFNGNASSTMNSANSAMYGATATTTISSSGKLGFATTTPTWTISGAAGTSIVILEKDLATSTSMTLNPINGSTQLARIGTAATTFTGAGFVPGAKIALTVCNPGSAAGAITWSGFHTFGTAPTQTTTANQCDAYTVGMTQATSTTAATGVLYYAQAGAGLQ